MGFIGAGGGVVQWWEKTECFAQAPREPSQDISFYFKYNMMGDNGSKADFKDESLPLVGHSASCRRRLFCFLRNMCDNGTILRQQTRRFFQITCAQDGTKNGVQILFPEGDHENPSYYDTILKVLRIEKFRIEKHDTPLLPHVVLTSTFFLADPKPLGLPIPKAGTDPLILELLKCVWTFSTYMDKALYDESFGYYTTGEVDFKNHFWTAASEGNHLAQQMAIQCYELWVSMCASGDLKEDEPFHFVELGAGTGNFCCEFLTFLQGYCVGSRSLQKRTFWENLRYKIGEISPALRILQAERNQKFIANQKLEIAELNARDLKPSCFQNSVGIVFSNELPDTFPFQAIRNREGTIEVMVLFPSIDKTLVKDDLLKKIEDQHTLYEKQFGKFVTPHCGDLLFSAELFSELPKDVVAEVKMNHIWLPVEYFPEIAEHLAHQDEAFLLRLAYDEIHTLNLNLPPFMERVSSILERGFAFTIDYGCPALHPKKLNQIRYFGDKERETIMEENYDKFFCQTGKLDLTAFVNFTDLSTAGKVHGLIPMAFFRQTHLSAVPKRIGRTQFDPLIGNDVVNYSVLVQRKEGTTAEFAINAITQPLENSEVLDPNFHCHRPNDRRLLAIMRAEFEEHFPEMKDDENAFHAYCQSANVHLYTG